MYYTYVLYSKRFDIIYIGQSADLQIRLKQHNDGKHRYTKRYIPWEIVHIEKFNTRTEAMKREKESKSHKGRDYIRNLLLRS
jgi:putative endonuclease